ncbi:MAG: excinuclease ATPase subunit [Silanimonas lenta]
MRSILLPALVLAAACASSSADARNTRHEIDFAATVERGLREGVLDGSVRFFLAGQAHPAVRQALGNGASSRKTNAANKSDEEACQWAALTVLKAFQQQAKARGANAVVNLVSNYDRVEFRGEGTYECRAGAIMAGVALKGEYALLAD